MKFKKLLILVLAAAVLVLLNVLKKFETDKDRSAHDRDARATVRLVQAEITPAFVDRVSIRKGGAGGDELTLVKPDGEWRIESRFGARAGSGQVENLIRKLSEARGEPRTDSADVLGDFLLREDQAYQISISAKGSDLARVLVSPKRSSPTENFARTAGSNRIFSTDTDFLSVLGIYAEGSKLDYKVFADLRVVPADVSKVTRIAASPAKGADVLLVKKEGSGPAEWHFDSDAGPDADTAKVNEFLSGVTNLFANDALDPAGTDYGFDENKVWLSLTESKDGKTAEYRLLLGSRSAGAVHLKSLPEARVFEVAEAGVDSLLARDKASFVPAPAPAAPASS